MRPEGDYRPARVYKLAVLRDLAPRGIAAVIDDDPEVIDAGMRAGLPGRARRLGAARRRPESGARALRVAPDLAAAAAYRRYCL